MLIRLVSYLRGLRRRRAIDSEASEELQFHVDRETEANVALGMPYAEARRVALRDLGGLTQAREGIRAVRTIGLGALASDVRDGVRALAGSPRFTLAALLTIVLMVGGITTIFTLVHAVLLRPLPYRHADRLVLVQSVQPNQFGANVSLADARAFSDQSQSFESWGLYRPGYVDTVTDRAGEPVDVQDLRVSPDVFPMFGIELAAGRPLLSSDGAPGAPDVAVISHELWQTIFGGEAGVVGRTLQVRGKPVTVVGITRPGANVPRNWLTLPVVWRPIRDEADFRLTAVARLREGATIERASHELAAIATRLAAVHPDTHKGRTATVTPLLEVIVGSFKRALWIFFGAVACVLLIGIGNLMSLQVARNGSREREITLRAALGASRWRVMRQLGVESMLMSALGGVVGFGLAVLAVRVVVARLPPGFPRAEDIQVDAGVAIFACGVTALIGVIMGALPAWQVSRVDLTMRLSEGGRSATLGASRSRVQRALIACQTAVALVLLVGAGLLGNSFYRLISRDAGMQEQGLSLVRGRLPKRYQDNAAQAAFWTSALEQVRAVEGVQAAALVVNSSGPLSGSDISTFVAPEGFAGSPLERFRTSYRRVSDRYFETLGLPIVKGRPILATDSQGAEPVIVVNELVATALWPGQSAIGKRLQFFNELRTVVGVIPAFRHERLDGDLEPQVFVPYVQRAGIASGSAIAFRGGSAGTAAAVSAVLRRLEGDLEPAVTTMADARWTLLATERFRATVLLVFASVAVFLALVGILGLVSYTIDQRRREIAVRVVIGAVRRDILRVVSRQALAPALAGLAAGVLGAGAAARLLTSFLVDIRPLDLPTFVAALFALALAAAAASLLPARRALTIQPMEALRAE